MELQSDRKEKYLFIETFGCQMNENDSERIIGLLRHLNYKVTDNPDMADMVILNTCSIRSKAEQKVYSALGRLKRLKSAKPGLIVGVGGCVAQQQGERLLRRVPHLDVVFGTHNIYRLPELVKEVEVKKTKVAATGFSDSIDEGSFEYIYTAKWTEGSLPRVKAAVTIMQGCDNFCSYCIVPYVRGRELSRKSGAVLQEINRLSENGIKEVMLVGQNVNSYGNDGGDISFPELLRRVCRVKGIKRVRFITSHPKDMSEELMELFGHEEKLCRHIHLPLQSGSNEILEKMKRGYTREDYMDRVFKLKRLYPDIGITTDIIVGFPGESNADFSETMASIKEIEYDNIFSFKYSPRPETVAASFDGQIPEQVKEERLAVLQKVQTEITFNRNRDMIGKVTDILVEGKSKTAEVSAWAGINQLAGRTSCNRIVNLAADDGYIGKITSVRIESAFQNSLQASLGNNN